MYTYPFNVLHFQFVRARIHLFCFALFFSVSLSITLSTKKKKHRYFVLLRSRCVHSNVDHCRSGRNETNHNIILKERRKKAQDWALPVRMIQKLYEREWVCVCVVILFFSVFFFIYYYFYCVRFSFRLVVFVSVPFLSYSILFLLWCTLGVSVFITLHHHLCVTNLQHSWIQFRFVVVVFFSVFIFSCCNVPSMVFFPSTLLYHFMFTLG